MSETIVRIVIEEEPVSIAIAATEVGGGGSATYAGLSDKATVDLPAVNTPLASALAGKQPLDADLTAIAALTTTANGRALLTSANALTIGASASVSGSNTGDNAVNTRYSGLVTNQDHTGDATGSTVLTLATVNANVGAWGSSAYTPRITVDEKGRITAASEEPTQISIYNVFDMGGGVSTALSIGVDTYGGFLTAGIGDTLPLERGGTGSTTASDARIALGAGTTGAELFGAADAAAANQILGRQTVRKTVDENLTNALLGSRTVSTDFAADAQLFIPLEANTLYRIEWGLLAIAPNIELLKARLTYPARDVTDSAGAAISCGAWGNAAPINHNGGATSLLLSNHVGANQVRGNIGMMTLNIGATPGNLRVEWGKVAPGTGNTTMLKNSYLIATKIP